MMLFNSTDLKTAKEKFEELKNTNQYHWLILSERFERSVGWENTLIETYYYYIYDGEDVNAKGYEYRYDNYIGYDEEIIKVYDGRAIMRDKQIDEILK